MKVHIEIGDLVLEGFNFHDHPRIRNSMEQELSRLIREGGLSSHTNGATIPKIDAGSFNITKNTEPAVIGSNVASMIYKKLTESIG